MTSINSLHFDVFQNPKHQPFFLNGNTAAVLLVHGFPGSPAEMKPIAEYLNELGWTVSVILLPGLGPDITNLTQKKHQDWIDEVNSALKNLSKYHYPVIIGGFSMGAALSIIAASKIAVNGLMLLAPYWRLPGIFWNMLPLISILFREVKPFGYIDVDLEDTNVRSGIEDFFPGINLDDPQVINDLKQLTIPTKLFNEIRIVGKLAETAAKSITVDTLVLQGKHDKVVTPKLTRKFVSKISVNIKYQEVEGEHDLPDPIKPAWEDIIHNIEEYSSKILTNSRINELF